ncbi:MAG: hypothetical protein ACOCZS_02210 [Verrucomicrobiota bacterium]
MNIFKLIRKIGKLLRGGVTHRQIALGAVLGIVLGFLPGLSLTSVLVVLLLIILNAHIGIALLGFAGGKILCFLLAPISFRLGYVIIHALGLEWLFRSLIATPVVALLNLQVYALVGAIPFMILFGWLFARLMIKIVDTVRFHIAGVTERSPRMQKLAENKIVRLFMWLVMGKKPDELLAEAKHRQPWLRKAGFRLLIGVVAIILIVDFLILTVFLNFGIERGIGFLNGAEVNLADSELSVLKGKLRLQGMEVTDPEDPEYNRFYIGETTVDFSVWNLLRKRLVVDDIVVADLKTDVKRETPGKVYEKPEEPEKVPEEEEVVEEKDWDERVEKARQWQRYAARFQEFLENRRQRKKPVQEWRKQWFETAANRGYLAMSADELLAENPGFLIRNLRAEGLRIPHLDNDYNFIGKNITRQPELLSEAMSFAMIQRDTDRSVAAIDFNFYEPDLKHRIQVDVEGVDVGEGSGLGDQMPVNIREGTLSLSADGDFSSQHLSIPFNLWLRDLEASPEPDESIAGLSPELTKRLFESMNEFSLKGDITGSLTSPEVDLDRRHLMSQLSDTVLKAGREELSRRAEEKLKESGGLDKLLKQGEGEDGDLTDGLRKQLPGLLDDSEDADGDSEKTDKEDEGKASGDDLEKTTRDALKNLF